MRARIRRPVVLILAAALGLGATAGCGELDHKRGDAKASSSDTGKSSNSAPKTPSPSLGKVVPPAADAGGLCKSLDYQTIHDTVGLDFDVAAPSQSNGTQACAVQSTSSELPSLTLSAITTQVSAKDFTDTFQPQDGKKLDGVGEAAYSKINGAGNGAGPSIEIGWSTGKQIYTLALLTKQGTSDGDANGYIAKLAELGKKIK